MTTSFNVFKVTPGQDGGVEFITDFTHFSNAVAYCESAALIAGQDSTNWDTDDEHPPLMLRLGNLDEVHYGIDIAVTI